eukprot:g17000.t1
MPVLTPDMPIAELISHPLSPKWNWQLSETNHQWKRMSDVYRGYTACCSRLAVVRTRVLAKVLAKLGRLAAFFSAGNQRLKMYAARLVNNPVVGCITTCLAMQLVHFQLHRLAFWGSARRFQTMVVLKGSRH